MNQFFIYINKHFIKKKKTAHTVKTRHTLFAFIKFVKYITWKTIYD